MVNFDQVRNQKISGRMPLIILTFAILFASLFIIYGNDTPQQNLLYGAGFLFIIFSGYIYSHPHQPLELSATYLTLGCLCCTLSHHGTVQVCTFLVILGIVGFLVHLGNQMSQSTLD